MTRRLVVAVLSIAVLSSVSAHAQDVITRGPLPPTAKVAWDAPDNVTSPAEAESFEARLVVNETPVTALTAVTCVAGVPVACQSPLSASNIDALNVVGVHALTLRLFRADVGESDPSSPFTFTSPAGAPTIRGFVE